MKTILLNLLILISFGNLFSQTENDFQDLLKIFKQGNDIEIPNSLAKKYFNYTPISEIGKALYAKRIVFENENFIGLSAYSDCGAGGICEHTDLIIFSHDGKIIEKLVGFESDIADCNFENIRYCSFSSDSLLIIVNKKTEGDCISDTLFSNSVKIEYLYILTNGKIKKGLNRIIDTRREFYTLSTDLLQSKDLNDKSKQELEVMRNEIFAAHGYKFKSENWIKYFSTKDWYEPNFENVENQLTEIERKNIELIIIYEKK